jgi:hypothetical protein
LLMKDSKVLRQSPDEEAMDFVADTTSLRILSAVAEVSLTVPEAFLRDTSTSPTRTVT